MAEQEISGTAQVCWLVAGPFGLGETGRTLTLGREDFQEALEKAKVKLEATVPERVGEGETRSVSLEVSSLKHFTLKHVIASVPELGELLGHAEKLSKLKDATPEAVREIVGAGRLADELGALLAPPDEASGAAPTGGDIFEQAEVPKKSVKGAIDFFVKSTQTSARQKSRPAARQLRDVVETVAYRIAADILESEQVANAERTWRGLRMLLSECPKSASMVVRLLETPIEDVVETLAERERADGIEEPDCIFIPAEIDSLPRLSELAELGEADLIPVVVGVPPTLFGTEDLQAVPEQIESLGRASNDEPPEWSTAWQALRGEESSRWLCAVVNRVALHSEGAGEAKRNLFGSGVWAVASMLAASYAAAGSFARIFGKAGSLRAPASHTLTSGIYADTAASTEAFYAIQPSEQLAQAGLLGLGSARNSDALVLTKAPMVNGAKDAVPLSAQILTGRVVRFASWVKAQLPEGCNSQTANEIYESAATVFLFPGQSEAAHVRAGVTNIDGEAHVFVRAMANPAIAGVPFEIVFPLPLNWSVPAPEDDDSEPASAPAAPSAGPAAKVEGKAPEKKDGVGLASSSVGFDASLDAPKEPPSE